MRRLRDATILSTILLAIGCSDGPAADPLPPAMADAGPADAASDAEVTPDADASADAEITPDADASADADGGDPPEVLRTLRTESLFGTLPSNNAVIDPEFGTVAENRFPKWLPATTASDPLRIQRAQPTSTPTGTAALAIPQSPLQAAVAIYGQILLNRAPHTVSLWFGRLAEGAQLAPTDIVVYGFNPDMGEHAQTRLLDDTGDEFTSDGIAWRRVEGQVVGYSGYAYLSIGDRTGEPFWLAGPSIVETPPDPLGLARAPQRGTPLSEEQTRELRRIQERMRRGSDFEPLSIEPIELP